MRRLPRARSTLFGVRYYSTWEQAERVRAAVFPGPQSKVVQFARGFAVRAYPEGPFYGARETHTRFDPAAKKGPRRRTRKLDAIGEAITRAEDTLARTPPGRRELARRRIQKLRRQYDDEVRRLAAIDFKRRPKRPRRDPSGPYHSALTEARERARAERRPVYIREHESGSWVISRSEPPAPYVKVLVDERAIRHGAADPYRKLSRRRYTSRSRKRRTSS